VRRVDDLDASVGAGGQEPVEGREVVELDVMQVKYVEPLQRPAVEEPPGSDSSGDDTVPSVGTIEDGVRI
jgi:hypothetical protein